MCRSAMGPLIVVLTKPLPLDRLADNRWPRRSRSRLRVDRGSDADLEVISTADMCTVPTKISDLCTSASASSFNQRQFGHLNGTKSQTFAWGRSRGHLMSGSLAYDSP